MKREQLERRLAAARGDSPAELVLKNARIVNVFSGEVQQGDVAVFERQGAERLPDGGRRLRP